MALKSEVIEEYVDYCCRILRDYFGAVRKNFIDQWDDPSSMLLSVISINGFIMALNRQLKINGVKDFDFYDRIFQNWEFSFSKAGFPYTSSQYRKFSTQILESAFGIAPEDLLHI